MRPRRHPFLYWDSQLSTADHACECCARAAEYTIDIQMAPRDLTQLKMFVCEKHWRLARRNMWKEIFADQNAKVDRMNQGART